MLVDDEKAGAKTRSWVGNRYGRWNTVGQDGGIITENR